MALSSLGDWLGLLANTALAQQLTAQSSVATQGVAISGVILVRLLPDLVLGPIAGALADKFDRRKTIIIGDTAAGLLFLSIAVGYNLTWLYVAQFLIEAVGLFTMPAKQAIWVNIVPRDKLAVGNQMSLISVYGMVPVAAILFAALSTLNRVIQDPAFASARTPIIVALVLNALSFFVGAGTVYLIRRDIPVFLSGRGDTKNVLSSIKEGVTFIRTSPVLRGLYVGILGAFCAGGIVIGVAQLYVATLDAGTAGYSVLFGTVFTGLAMGMVVGPRILPAISRRRLFGLTIGLAGFSAVGMSLMRDFVLAAVFAFLVGAFAGMAWINGYTMIGYEVADRLRGRVFAFMMSSVRVSLLLTVAVGPLLAGALGQRTLRIGSSLIVFTGPGTALLIAGLFAMGVGVYAYRRVGVVGGRSLVDSLVDSARSAVAQRTLRGLDEGGSGFFVTFEGPPGATTAAHRRALTAAVEAAHYSVVCPGGLWETPAGARIEALLGDSEAHLAIHTELLLHAASRAELVARTIGPALEAKQVVLMQRYVDASVACRISAGGANVGSLRRTPIWAPGDLVPDLTVVLDVDIEPADAGRRAFLLLADLAPDRYLVIPAGTSFEESTARVAHHVLGRLAALGDRTARVSASVETAVLDPAPNETVRRAG